MQSLCLEIVKWKGNPGVTNMDMIKAVECLLPDLNTCPGFLHQSLYKDASDQWIDIYYWADAESAHNSNEHMADKESLKALLRLIDTESVTIEVMPPRQSSGPVNFT